MGTKFHGAAFEILTAQKMLYSLSNCVWSEAFNKLKKSWMYIYCSGRIYAIIASIYGDAVHTRFAVVVIIILPVFINEK